MFRFSPFLIFMSSFVFKNASIVFIKINSLTSLHANMFLVGAVIAIAWAGVKNNRLVFLFWWGCVFCSCKSDAGLIPGLTNTFFVIHPTILYLSSCLCLTHPFKRLTNWPVAWLSVALCLGGFWSMQELNWGGWWNWDSLEVGSALILILILARLHIKMQSKKIFYKSFFLNLLWSCSYYALNKLGLATSIHSFIASRNARINFIYFLIKLGFLAIGLTFCLNRAQWVIVIFALWVYSSFKNLNALKPLTLVLAFLFLCKLIKGNSLTKGYHFFYKICCILFIAYNMHNVFYFIKCHALVSVLKTAKYSKLGAQISFENLNACQVYIQKELCLSKPRMFLSHNNEISQTRYMGKKTFAQVSQK